MALPIPPTSFASLAYPDTPLESLYGWLSAWSRFQSLGSATGFADEYRGLLQGRAVSGERPGLADASDRPQVRLPQFALVDRQGVPLHRILLVYAPPSSGKTSAVLCAVRGFGFTPFLIHAASNSRAELQEEVRSYVQKTETPSLLNLLAKASKAPREFLIVDDADCCPDTEALNFLLSLASHLYYKQPLKTLLPKNAASGPGDSAGGREARTERPAAPVIRRRDTRGTAGKRPASQQKPTPAIFVVTNPFAIGLKPLRERALVLNLRFPDPQKVFLRVSTLYPGLSGAEVASSLNRAVEIANGNLRFLLTSLNTLTAMLACDEPISMPGWQFAHTGKTLTARQDKGLTVRAVEAIMLVRSSGGYVGLARAILLRSLVFAFIDETTEYSSLPARNSSALVSQVKACGIEIPYLASLYSLPTLAKVLLAKNYDSDSLQAALRRIEETADQTLLQHKFSADRDIPFNASVCQFYDDMSFLHTTWSGAGGNTASGLSGSESMVAMSALLGLYASLAESPFHPKIHENVYRALTYPAPSGYVAPRTINSYYEELYTSESVIALDPRTSRVAPEPGEKDAKEGENGGPSEVVGMDDPPSLYSLLGARRNTYLTEYLPYAVLTTTSAIPDTGNFSLLSPDSRNSLLAAAAAECYVGFFEGVDKVSAAQEKELERQERLRGSSAPLGPGNTTQNTRTPSMPSSLSEALKNVMSYNEGKQSFGPSYCIDGGLLDASWARQRIWGFAFRRLTRNSVILFLSISRSMRALQAAVHSGRTAWNDPGLTSLELGRALSGHDENRVLVSQTSIRLESYQKFLENEILRQLAQAADRAAVGVSNGRGRVSGVVYEFHEGTTQAVRRRMRGKDFWAPEKVE